MIPISANWPKTGWLKNFCGLKRLPFNLIREHFYDKKCHLPSLGRCSAGHFGKTLMSGWMVKEHLDEVVFAVTVTSSSFHLERGRRREIMFVCVCVCERKRERGDVKIMGRPNQTTVGYRLQMQISGLLLLVTLPQFLLIFGKIQD